MRGGRHRRGRRGTCGGLRPAARLAAAVVAAVATSLAGCSGAPAKPVSQSPQPAAARIIAVGGPVQAAVGGQRRPAKLNQQLPAGSELISSVGGTATVALPGGASITIAGASTFRYAADGGDATGQLDAVAPRKQPLRLAVALAQIRATGPLHLRAGAVAGSRGLTRVTVLDGVASVAYDGGRTDVPAGQRLTLRPAAGSPSVLPTLTPASGATTPAG